MSDANRTRVSIARSTGATFPITLSPNQLNTLRTTGSPDLAFRPITIASNEIRSDRNRPDLILVGGDAGGGINFELSPNTFDDLIESALFSSWTNTPQKKGTSEITAFGSNTTTLDDASDFKIGHMVRFLDMDASSDPVGEGVYEVTGKATETLTLAAFNADTNAITASMVADADTRLIVVGFTGAASGDIDYTLSSGTGGLVISGARDFDNLMSASTHLVPGQWIKISADDTPLNSVWARIKTRTTTTITFDAPTGYAAGDGTNVVIWFGDYLSNGVESLSSHKFAVESRFEDHSPVSRQLFIGMLINTLSISMTPIRS
jgi:hypothetical protein